MKRQITYTDPARQLLCRVLDEKQAESLYELANGQLNGIHFTIYQNGKYMRVDFHDKDGIPLDEPNLENFILVRYDYNKTLCVNISKAYQEAINAIYDMGDDITSQDNPFGSWGAYTQYRYGNYWQMVNRERKAI